MLFTGMNSKVDRTVVEGASHLNNKVGSWWKDPGLRTLNFLIFIPLMSEYVQGYDASLINVSRRSLLMFQAPLVPRIS